MSPKNARRIGFFVSAVFAIAPLGLAQLPNTELHTIYPHAAAAGQEIEVSLTGLNLDELTGLHFSDPRIKAERVLLPDSEFRKYPAQNGTKFKVTIPADIPPGTLEVRSAGFFGLSTSRPFDVVAKDTAIVADAGSAHFKTETAPELPLEAIAYGRTDPNQIDYWKFPAKKGQRLLIHCRSERLDAKTDATLVVIDASGNQLERNRDHFGRDPMIDFTAPADGHYFAGVHDFTFNGGADYPYTLTVTAKPLIDFVYPPAGQPGQPLDVILFGRNLPGGSPGEGHQIGGKVIETVTARITVPNQPSQIRFDDRRASHGLVPTFDYTHPGTHPVRMGFAKAPIVPEQAGTESQTVPVPCEIAGRFDQTADTDQFRFTAKKGTSYWVEVIGDRLEAKVDPYILVEKITRPAEGDEIYAKVKDGDDDAGEGGAFFDDKSRDTALSFAADQDGDYRVTIVNQFDSGGIDHLYRLGIREAEPDFQVLAIAERPYHDARQQYSAAPLIRPGGTAPLKIVVKREDGFDQPVTVTAAGLPAGVTCPPHTLHGAEEVGYLVFAGAPDAKGWAGTVKVTGKGKIGETEIIREARLGTLSRGVANNTTERVRGRLDTQIPLAVSAEEKAPVLIDIADRSKPLTVEMDQKLDIPIKLANGNNLKGNLAVTAEGLKGLVKSPAVNIAQDKTDGTLSITFKNQNNVFNQPAPGTYSFVLLGKGTQTKYRHNPKAAERAAEEAKLVDELVKKYTDEATRAKAAVTTAKTTFDAATKNAASATADAKAAADKAVADAKAAYDAAVAASAEADKKKAAADTEKRAAPAKIKAATDKAKEKDVKFAAYSLPITVVVTPKPEPEKK